MEKKICTISIALQLCSHLLTLAVENDCINSVDTDGVLSSVPLRTIQILKTKTRSEPININGV